MSSLINGGRPFAVGFLFVCCAIAVYRGAADLLSGKELSILSVLPRSVFVFFAGCAAWNINHWRKLGWFLGLFVVLQWFSGLINGPTPDALTLWLTLPLICMAVWLMLPAVRGKFGFHKVSV